MTIDFAIKTAKTVPTNYSWDKEIPFENNTVQDVTPPSNIEYVFGYAPGVKITFTNISKPDINIQNITYTWNFGDYYNDTTNTIALTSLDDVEHIFVMPGKYSVQLKAEETILDPTVTFVANDQKCLGKYNIRWFWNDLKNNTANNITWNQTRCVLQDNTIIEEDRRPKWWVQEEACIQKYCANWSWFSLSQNSETEPIKWRETKTDAIYEKSWQFEDNNIECAPAYAVTPFKKIVRKPFIVEVKEIPPKAGITCLTVPLTGKSPLTVELSPKGCMSGSFPIDRIDWDFGDGSPIVTVTRYSNNNFDNVHKKIPLALSGDPDDVRNYNVTHTYVVNEDTYPVFYPSLTCYSANTNTSDSCCTVIGPLIIDYQPTEIEVLKVRNTLKGNIYALDINNNITFVTSNTINRQKQTVIPTKPSSPIRDTKFIKDYDFIGNPGNDYLNAPEILIT
jgi:hypothetical protein